MDDRILPEYWQNIVFGHVATLQRGNDLPKDDREPGIYPVLGSNGIVGTHSAFVAVGPGVTVGRSGSVGKVLWIDGRFWPLNTTLWVKNFHGNDERFVYYLLGYLRLERYAAGVSVPTLNRNALADIPIALPPLAEQRAIARALRTVQAAGEARRREIALERERKAALMQYLFAYGTRNEPTHDTELGSLPESWLVVPLGDTGKIVTGTTPPTKNPAYYGVDYMFITPADVGASKYVTRTERYLSAEGLGVSRVLPQSTVLITCIGNIGRISMTTVASATNQQINAVIPNRSVVPDFLYYAVAFRAPHLLALAGRTVLPIVNKSNLAAFAVPVAPLDEQRVIADVLGACDAKVATLEREAALHDELYRAMLEELMSGRLSAMSLIQNGMLPIAADGAE